MRSFIAQIQVDITEDLKPIFDQAVEDATGVVTDNLGWFIAIFTFYLVIRFAPALLSWFRHRNDPKQMGDF